MIRLVARRAERNGDTQSQSWQNEENKWRCAAHLTNKRWERNEKVYVGAQRMEKQTHREQISGANDFGSCSQ